MIDYIILIKKLLKIQFFKSYVRKFLGPPLPLVRKSEKIPNTPLPPSVSRNKRTSPYKREVYSVNLDHWEQFTENTTSNVNSCIEYVIDSYKKANIACFLNHSCVPNAFLQSVYTTTHDDRFPNLALFAFRYV